MDGLLQVLRHEHESIRQLLHALDGMSGAMREGRKVECADAKAALHAVASYADGCHHAKEEDALFPAILESRQATFAKGLIPALEREHVTGRRLVDEMLRNVEPACVGDMRALTLFAHAAHQYAHLQQAHLRKEEHDLMPLAAKLSGSAMKAVAKSFQRIEAKHPDHAATEARIQDLAAKYARYANAAA